MVFRTLVRQSLKSLSTAKEPLIEKFSQKSVRVSILGGGTRTGQTLALLLKQNPLISKVFLYDVVKTQGIAADLQHLDTRCEVFGFTSGDLSKAIKNADVIVLLGADSKNQNANINDQINNEGSRLVEMATACAITSPKAVLVNCVSPISISLPIISEIYRKNHWYHPGKIIGSVALLQIRINTLLGRHQNLDPTSVNVPLCGGPDDDTILPLFSRASPLAVPLKQAKVLINRFKNLEDGASPTEMANTKTIFSPNSNAFAINRLVTTIALGLLGDNNAIYSAYVRSNFIDACRHIVSSVKFGPTGVVHNYGVPKLTNFELKMFEKVTLELGKRERFAREYMKLSTCMNAPTSLEEVGTSSELYVPCDVKKCDEQVG